MHLSEHSVEGKEPSDEELALMRAATPAQANIVDAMILGQCELRWRKVARVVGALLNGFDQAFGQLPCAYIQARMQELEDSDLVEIAGDIWSVRHAEIRLVGQALGA